MGLVLLLNVSSAEFKQEVKTWAGSGGVFIQTSEVL